jgi:glutathione S-transferase
MRPAAPRTDRSREEKLMADVTLYGFPISTYVIIARMVLTQKNVAYEFHDLETGMGKQGHLALHPFNRVPILKHGDFRVYETAAIAGYVDEAFGGDPLQPTEPRARARMQQWVSSLNSYYYPYIVYHLNHERLVFPALGIAADEKVVSAALPKIATALDVMEDELKHGEPYLVGAKPTLADFFMLPSMTGLSLTAEGEKLLTGKARINAWRARMGELPSVQTVRAAVAPYVGKPIPHARDWVNSHRPKY